MEEIYSTCFAQQDSQRAAPQFTSIYWIKALQSAAMAHRFSNTGVEQRASTKPDVLRRNPPTLVGYRHDNDFSEQKSLSLGSSEVMPQAPHISKAASTQ